MPKVPCGVLRGIEDIANGNAASKEEIKEIMKTDPHEDDYCVVCENTPEPNGPKMHPVASIENGCVCQNCVDSKLLEVAKGNRSPFK